MLCSVTEHAGNGKSTKKVGGNTSRRWVFFSTSWVLSPLSECFITEKSTAKASLFYDAESIIF